MCVCVCSCEHARICQMAGQVTHYVRFDFEILCVQSICSVRVQNPYGLSTSRITLVFFFCLLTLTMAQNVCHTAQAATAALLRWTG